MLVQGRCNVFEQWAGSNMPELQGLSTYRTPGLTAMLLAVLAVIGFACRPPAESRPMPVVVESDGEGGWTVIVPICDNGGIARFDLLEAETM